MNPSSLVRLPRACSTLEILESRIAPAYIGTYADVFGRQLTLTGDFDGHSVDLRLSGTKTLIVSGRAGGPSQEFDLTGVDRLVLEGGASLVKDQIRISEEVVRFVGSIQFDGGAAGDRLTWLGSGSADSRVVVGLPIERGYGVARFGDPASNSRIEYSHVPDGIDIQLVAQLTVEATGVKGATSMELQGNTYGWSGGGGPGNSMTFGDLRQLTLPIGKNNDGSRGGDYLLVTQFPKGVTKTNVAFGAGDDQVTFAAAASSQMLGSTFTVDGGAGLNTVAVNAYNISLDDRRLQLESAVKSVSAVVGLKFFQTANLIGGAGSNRFDITGWSGGGNIFGGEGIDTVISQGDRDYTVTGNRLLRADLPTINLEAMEQVNLTGGAGDNTLRIGATKLEVRFIGLAGKDSLIVEGSGGDFQVTPNALTRSAASGVTYDASLEVISLTGSSSNNEFVVNGFAGQVFLQGVGGDDRLTVTTDRLVSISGNTVRSPGSGPSAGYPNLDITHSGLETIRVQGLAPRVEYIGTGVEELHVESGVLRLDKASSTVRTIESNGQFIVSQAKSLDILVGDTTELGTELTSLSPSFIQANMYKFVNGATIVRPLVAFSEIPAVTLETGYEATAQSADRVTIHSLAAAGLEKFTIVTGDGDDLVQILDAVHQLRGPGGDALLDWDAGAGTDLLYAYGDYSMSLRPEALAFQDNTPAHRPLGGVNFIGAAVETASLVGGESGNRFVVAAPRMTVSVYAAGGHDVIDVSGGVRGMISGERQDFPTILDGGDGEDTFILQETKMTRIDGLGGEEGSEAGFIRGGAGRDTIVASGDIDFRLSDTSLSRSYLRGGAFVQVVTGFLEIEHAVLTGGDHRNLLDAGAFSGTSDLAGGGQVDNLVASRGGGGLYGYSREAVKVNTAKNYTRDNFFAPDGTAKSFTTIYATHTTGNLLSFRYYQNSAEQGVEYRLPEPKAANSQLVSAEGSPELVIAMPKGGGALTMVEGSSYGDTLTGNRLANVLSGGAGDDLLRASGADVLMGGAGQDRLVGPLALKLQTREYLLPGSEEVLRAAYDPTKVLTPAELIERMAELTA